MLWSVETPYMYNLLTTVISDGSVTDNYETPFGKNIYTIAGPSPEKRQQWEYLNSDPGIIHLITPHGIWKRKLFNGLAQVIVQSDRKPGEIKLTANSSGLKSAEILIRTKQVKLRPAVP